MNNWIILAGMIIVGVIFLLASQNIIFGWIGLTNQDIQKAEVEKIVSLIYRTSLDPSKKFFYCIDTSPPVNITVKDNSITFQRSNFESSYIVPEEISDTSLVETTKICVLKNASNIELTDKVMLTFCDQNRTCRGAPEAFQDFLGKDCCPADKPTCTSGHCCPTDKPKYCKKPKAGEPRCMTDAELKTDCASFHICDGTFPDKFDWRNVNGQNWVSPVKDQGNCGSCWAFSTVGAIEGIYNVEQDTVLNPNLAEQDLVSCSGAGSCAYGGWPHLAFPYITSSGVVDEQCFPYAAADIGCSKCGDASQRLWKITNYASVSSDFNEIKKALVCHGPLSIASMNWMHAIVLVGYDDSRSVWIFKNSWGTGYGNGGFGEIPYTGNIYSDVKDYVYYVQGVIAP